MARDRTDPARAARTGLSAVGGYQDWSRASWRLHLPAVADVPSFAEGLAQDTIPALATASAVAVPDRVAVTVDGEPMSHRELDDGAAQVAGWLARRVQPGDRILLAAAASLGFVRCYLGALRAGAVAVLANPGFTAAELRHLVADSGAVLAFADPEPARLLAGLSQGPGSLLTVSVGDLPSGSGRTEGIAVGPHDIALLAYTSGTTGKPKGVPLTHGQLAASIRSAMAAWRWSPGEVLAHALPLYHQHGLSGVHAALIAGGTVHIRSRFTPADLLRTIEETRATVLFAVPTIYQALMDAGIITAAGQPGLRLAVCGSAPLSPALAGRLTAVLDRVPLIRYGTTESGLNVSNPVDDPRGDTVGIPLPGVLARIAAADGDAELGADGEIQVRGPQVFDGYWHDPAATAAAFTPDGWFRTGDVGTLDTATGHLRIRGRIKEMIITGGLNVYPREVEIVLEDHPSVAEAAVAGVPHQRWGEQVTAWVVLRDGHRFDEAALIAHARTRLAGYKCPKQVFQLAAMPRNHVGKIIRSALRAGLSGHDGLPWVTLTHVRALPVFDCRALFSALDTQRRDRGLDWFALADELWQQSSELNARRTDHPLCGGAISRLSKRGATSCQYALFMLRWLHRAPEDFLTGPVADVGDVTLPEAGTDSRLRWNLNQVHAALNEERAARGLTWAELAHELNCTPNRLTNLRTARLADMDLAMRVTQWLGQPAAAFIHPAQW